MTQPNKTKPFSKSLHLEYDIPGKLAVLSGLNVKGLKGTVLSDKNAPYRVDLLITDPETGQVYYNDPEVKTFWSEYELPALMKAEGLDIPFRKRSLLTLDKPVYLSTVNSIFSRFAAVKGEYLVDAKEDMIPNPHGVKTITKPNRFSKGKDEFFFRVPWEKITLIDVPDHEELQHIQKHWKGVVDLCKGNFQDTKIKKMLGEVAQKISDTINSEILFQDRLHAILDYLASKENKSKWFEIAKQSYMNSVK